METIFVKAELRESKFGGEFFVPLVADFRPGEQFLAFRGSETAETVWDPSDDSVEVMVAVSRGRGLVVVPADGDAAGPAIEVEAEMTLCEAGQTYLVGGGDPYQDANDDYAYLLTSTSKTVGRMKGLRVVNTYADLDSY